MAPESSQRGAGPRSRAQCGPTLSGRLALNQRAGISRSLAKCVPATRAAIFAKAVSRLVELSSQKGEKPQSSGVPSCASGVCSAACSTRSHTCSGVSICGFSGSMTPAKAR